MEESPPEKKHDLGILFVHGIGEQPEGDTLLSFSQPVVQWIKGWLSRETDDTQRGSIHVIDAILTPSKRNQSVPPHAVVVVNLPKDQASSWLIAESWWAGEVKVPEFGKMAGWMLTVGAWTILTHVTKRAATCKANYLRLLAILLMVGISLPVSLALQVTVLFLSLLALLPIPYLRRGLSGILLWLTGTLGDTYVLVESDLQRSAIISKTEQALDWLAKRCEAVLVFAHSQGAAVSHRALRSTEPQNVEIFFTFGSGIGKLEELIIATGYRGYARFISKAIPLMFLTIAAIGYIIFFEGLDFTNWLVVMVLGGGTVFGISLASLMLANYWDRLKEWAPTLSLERVRPNLKWLDFFATHDLVPNGPLNFPDDSIKGLTSSRLVNLRSWLFDHTAYWSNRSVFLPKVVRVIAEAAKLNLFSPRDNEELTSMFNWHARNVRWWVVARWSTVASVLLMFWLLPDQLLTSGKIIYRSLNAVSDYVLIRILKFLAELLFPPSHAATRELGLTILGAAIPFVFLFVWFRVYRLIWQWWDDIPVEHWFENKNYLNYRRSQHIVDVCVIALGFCPLFCVLGWKYYEAIVPTMRIGHVLGIILAGLLVVVNLVAWIRFPQKMYRLIRGWRHGDVAVTTVLREYVDELAWCAFLILLLNVSLIGLVPEDWRTNAVSNTLVSAVIIGLILGFDSHWRLNLRRNEALASTFFDFASSASVGTIVLTVSILRLYMDDEDVLLFVWITVAVTLLYWVVIIFRFGRAWLKRSRLKNQQVTATD